MPEFDIKLRPLDNNIRYLKSLCAELNRAETFFNSKIVSKAKFDQMFPEDGVQFYVEFDEHQWISFINAVRALPSNHCKSFIYESHLAYIAYDKPSEIRGWIRRGCTCGENCKLCDLPDLGLV